MEDVLEYHRTFLNAAIYRPLLLNVSALEFKLRTCHLFLSLFHLPSQTQAKTMCLFALTWGIFSSLTPFSDPLHSWQTHFSVFHHRTCLPCWPPTPAHNFLPFSMALLPGVAKISTLTTLLFSPRALRKITLHFLSESCLNSFIRKTETHNRGSVFPSNSHNPTITLRCCVVWATRVRRGKHSCPCLQWWWAAQKACLP